jgi:hypothetical protein
MKINYKLTSFFLLAFLLSLNTSANTETISDSKVVQGVMNSAKIVNGGNLTLQGVATGSILIEEGGSFVLQGVANGTITNNGGNLIIQGTANTIYANLGYTEISGIVNYITGNGKINIKPGAMVAGRRH